MKIACVREIAPCSADCIRWKTLGLRAAQGRQQLLATARGEVPLLAYSVEKLDFEAGDSAALILM